MVHALLFLSSKCSLFHNSNVFGSCVNHILYTGCAKIKKNNSGAKRLKIQSVPRNKHPPPSSKYPAVNLCITIINVCSGITTKRLSALC